jgi:serine/threonine protein phosphatase PrpC
MDTRNHTWVKGIKMEEKNVQSAEVAAGLQEKAVAPPIKKAGDVIGGRYQILAYLETTDNSNIYSIKLTKGYRCAACFHINEEAEGEMFCDDCGSDLTSQTLQISEVFTSQVPVGATIQETFQEANRTYYFAAPGKKSSEAQPIAGAMEVVPVSNGLIHLSFGFKSDVGMVREIDEDSVMAAVLAGAAESFHFNLAFFAVADGMGGYEKGEVASKLTLQVIAGELLQKLFLPLMQEDVKTVMEDSVKEHLKEAVKVANTRVYQLGKELSGSEESGMGCTLTMAVIVEDMAYIANVGDSRTYLLNAAGLKRITVDHSLVETLVERGEIRPEEVYTHPRRNIITRSIGSANVEVDTFVHKLNPGDQLILCCDGLWEMIQDIHEIQDIVNNAGNPQIASNELIKKANDYGGEDNISVIVVKTY